VKAYLRFDPMMDESKGHCTPAQLGAFVKIVCLASRQKERGRFRSMAALRKMLSPAYARHLPFLIEEGDVVELPDGRAYIDGWDEWQEGDWTVAERMARLRDKGRNNVSPEPSPTAIGIGIGIGISGANAPSPRATPDDGRYDLEAFLVVKRRPPSTAQRKVLDMAGEHLGYQRVAELILGKPDDPIGAVIEADKAHVASRIAVAKAQEDESAQRRRKARDPLQAEIAAALRAKHGDEERYVPPEKTA
jgi:hypothetical protein